MSASLQFQRRRASAVARILGEGALRARGIRREDRGRLVVDVHLDLRQSLRDEQPGHAIAERVVAFAESDLASLARQLEAHELHDLVDARLVRDGIEEQRLGQVVGLRDRDEPARPGHAQHLGDRGGRIGQVDEHRLAGREIERVVRKGKALRLALPVREAPLEPARERALARLFDPARLAIDAGDTHVLGHDRREQHAPVTDAAAHVEHVADGVELPALRHQPQEVEVPPVIARVAEILRGVRRLSLELVAH